MLIENPDDIRIGMWYTLCCDITLKAIDDAAELEEVLEWLREDQADPEDAIGIRVWADEEEARQCA